MFKTISIALLISLTIFTPAFSQETKTIVNNKAAKARLLGVHRLSLQWIGWDYFGKAKIIEQHGVLTVSGEQKSRKDSNYLTINGKIVRVDAKQFVFDGKIVTKVSYINNGEPCVREGEMTFKITGNRKYWRLQEMLNPCTNKETDYVDVFF